MEYIALILFFIFLTLKLAGVGVVATWPWLYVFLPAIAFVALYSIATYIHFVERKNELKNNRGSVKSKATIYLFNLT
jgi:hypothetical protein